IMAAPLGRDTLPEHWSYGVCRDGRVFFINDKTRSTTWLHPRTGEPVNSGHMIRSGTVIKYAYLPRGWEEGFTEEGASYFINHNLRTTTFRHPVTGHISSENTDFILQDQANLRMSKPPPEPRPPSMVSESSVTQVVFFFLFPQSLKPSGKVHCFGKRDHSIKRNPNVPVVVRGWLYKQDSSGMRLWKRKWFVLSDYCLFYYKDSREETVLGSIPLPSYVISPVGPEDHISRKYAFKACHTGMRSYIYNKNSLIGSQAEHCGMRTYFFSADTQEDMNGWIWAMNQAALMQSHGVKRSVTSCCCKSFLRAEHWVKVQKGDPKSHPTAEYTLPRRTPPLQPKSVMMETYQSLPKSTRHHSGGSSPPVPRNLPSDYKYAHDRLSHFRMSTDERMATKEEGMVWQLYEWQQRQQFRHGSPTAPIYTGPDYMDTSAFRVTLEMPRSISVPPSPCDIPPPGHPSKFLSPRRPHTPSDRVTVRPLDDFATVDTPSLGSPRGICSQISKTSQIERRSMPTMGYITHTVSAPSLHGKTVTGRDSLKDRPPRPVKIAESDIDVTLSTLSISDKLESVLDVSHQQMEQYQDQPAHAEKVAYQQKLLREDVVHIRADISQVSTEMENAWAEYSQLERDVDRLRSALQDQMTHSQEKSQLRKELWRIEDVLAGLSSSKANYKVTIDSVRNPERKLVPSASLSAVPSLSASPFMGELKAAQPSPHLSLVQSTQQPLQLSHTAHKPKWSIYLYLWTFHVYTMQPEEDAPPRPPLPHLYSPDEHPPAVPPLPKETSVIRHTSVRGLKRQSDERKRDREIGQYPNGDHTVEIRAFLSEPELLTVGGLSRDSGYQTLPNRGLTGSSSRLNQSSNISSFVTLRRGLTTTSLKERPKSALERLYSGEPMQQRSRMSAEEQLERMKRHQKALVRERKRTLSQGERQASSSRLCVFVCLQWRREQDFDLQLLEQAVQGEERPVEHRERQRSRSDEWLTLSSTPMRELDLEPLDYQLDLSKELAKPQKVAIPERYVDMDPEEPLSPQEMEARHRKVERIKSILAKSSVQNIPPPAAVDKPVLPDIDSALQEQERIITMSYALASEASLKSKQVSAPPPLSNGFHYTFV
uniref:Pleckstrin homology domain-containing family A member 7-like n=1 Tax=Sinocyclocheilus rhinocerous TaxID=307959 RepID=A0A673N8P4_9TELE